MSPNIPSFHDGSVMGVVLGDGSATLYMRQSSGQEFTLALEGLEVPQMEDFREGNIVLSVDVITRSMPHNDNTFDRLFMPPHHSAETHYHERHQAFVKHQLDHIESGETKLVVIESHRMVQQSLGICVAQTPFRTVLKGKGIGKLASVQL